MSIELKKTTMNDVVGEPSKFKAVFKGYYHDKPVTVTFEAETERDLSYVVQLVPGRELELDIIDHQATLDAFYVDEKKLKEVSANAKRIMDEKERIAEEEAYRDERRRRAEASA